MTDYSDIPDRELVRMAQSGDVEARNSLVTRHMGFLHRQAFKLKAYIPLDTDDLVQEGVFGLIKAVEKFDLSVPVKFLTYAGWYARAAMQNAKCSGRTRQDHFDNSQCSIYYVGNGDQILSPASESESPEWHAEHKDDISRLKTILDRLFDKREADILLSRMNGETMKSIGKRLSISKQRVDQIESRCLVLIREHWGNMTTSMS